MKEILDSKIHNSNCFPRRVLMVLNSDHFFLSHRLELAKALQEQGYEVHVAGPKGDDTKKIESLGFVFHSILLDRMSKNLWKELGCFISLYRLYRRLKPTVVHHFTIKPVIYGSIAARLTKIPIVVNAITGLGYVFVESNFRIRVLRRIIMSAYRFALRLPNNRVIFQNSDDLAFFVNSKLVKLDQAVLIKGSGVNTQKFVMTKEAKTNEIVIILASRMLWHKGVSDFVAAAVQLKRKKSNVRFVLVGSVDVGNPKGITKKQLDKWHQKGIVEWWGKQDNMPAIFSNAHIVCLPSFYREGIPRVLIEAASCGRPIVTTDMPGCREIVRNGENGFLVPIKDISALIYALKKLIEKPNLRLEMGKTGREMVEIEYSIEHVNTQTLAIYKELATKYLSEPCAV